MLNISTQVVTIFLIFIFFTSCSSFQIDSKWQSDEIQVDGSMIEWKNDLIYYEKEKISIAFSNDDNYLYLCLATSERSKMMNILLTGLTIWFDPQNSKGKTLGIQYPIRKERDPGVEMHMKNIRNNSEEELNVEKMFKRFGSRQSEILIVNEDNFPLIALSKLNENGIEASLGIEMKQLVYELKFPIVSNEKSNIFIDALPGQEIKISFESEEFERPEREGGMRGNQGMRMSGSGGRGIRGGNQIRKGGIKEFMKPISLSIDIKLSSNKEDADNSNE